MRKFSNLTTKKVDCGKITVQVSRGKHLLSFIVF